MEACREFQVKLKLTLLFIGCLPVKKKKEPTFPLTFSATKLTTIPIDLNISHDPAENNPKFPQIKHQTGPNNHTWPENLINDLVRIKINTDPGDSKTKIQIQEQKTTKNTNQSNKKQDQKQKQKNYPLNNTFKNQKKKRHYKIAKKEEEKVEMLPEESDEADQDLVFRGGEDDDEETHNWRNQGTASKRRR